jgi:hypothetical protein
MSIPVPSTFERQNLDANQRTIARSLLTVVENLAGFDAYIATFAGAALEEPPYNYSVDEAYALQRFAQLGAAFAELFEAGGTLSAADATTLREVTQRSAGAVVFTSGGM